MARCRLALVLVLAGSLCGCQAIGTWAQDRARDATDIVDVRYGTGVGLGLRLDATTVLWTGLGYSTESYYREWYGRKSVEVEDGLFVQAVLIGVDGLRRDGDATTGAHGLFLLNQNGLDFEGRWRGDAQWFEAPAGNPPNVGRLRFGGVAFLPGVSFGAYLNVGEAVDFLGGLLGLDLMRDDGLPKLRRGAPAGEPSGEAPNGPVGDAGGQAGSGDPARRFTSPRCLRA